MGQHAEQSTAVSARLFVSGRVQGVGYRNFCFKNAVKLGLRGRVRNLRDGRVALEVGGEREKIEALIRLLWQGPPRSEVLDLSISWEVGPLDASGFTIEVE